MKKSTTRIIAWILIIMLTLGLFSGAFVMFANAAVTQEVLAADTVVSPSTLTEGKFRDNVKITFKFKSEDYGENGGYIGELDMTDFTIPSGSAFAMSTKTKLEVTDDGPYYTAVLSNVLYTGAGARALELYIYSYDPEEPYYFYVPLIKQFRSSGSEDEEPGTPVSDIYWQSTIVRDSAGKKLGSVDKKTGRFNIEVIFYDIGLKAETNQSIDDAKKYAFITTSDGFKLHKGTLGTVERISSNNEYPRFRATFEGIESTGTANSLSFNVIYDFPGYDKSIISKAVSAKLFQIDAESSSSEDDEIAPLIPNVIVAEYSYGDKAIVAGNEFNLDVVFSNTSKTLAVENVVMTVEPGNGFLIAAASNTTYFPNLNAGESKPYSVGLRALPSQNTTGTNNTPTDYSVTIKFSYQYLAKKEYGKYETTTKIAIPVEQLDRFSVDEITDYTAYISAGSEGYVTVPITNKGKSATMNISGSIKSGSGADFVAAPVHVGNLEAGKSTTVSISITVNTPGEFAAEAVISYEDENMNQKELTAPFTIMVEQPWTPPPEMPVDPGMEQPQNKISPFSIALCIIGGLMLASPAAMILMKRIKSRGNEDIDEDF